MNKLVLAESRLRVWTHKVMLIISMRVKVFPASDPPSQLSTTSSILMLIFHEGEPKNSSSTTACKWRKVFERGHPRKDPTP